MPFIYDLLPDFSSSCNNRRCKKKFLADKSSSESRTLWMFPGQVEFGDAYDARLGTSTQVLSAKGQLRTSMRSFRPFYLSFVIILLPPPLLVSYLQQGDQYNSTPARKLSQSFNLDIIGGSAITPKQVCLRNSRLTIMLKNIFNNVSFF